MGALPAMEVSKSLAEVITEEIQKPVSKAAETLASELRIQFGDAVQAILFYGSCLRTGNEEGAILDLYVLIDDYKNAYTSRKLTWLNMLLPPNVFYLEVPIDGRMIRTKYAVISLDHFAYGTSSQCFHSYYWARFAQPCALVYTCDVAVMQSIVQALANAVETFIIRGIPLLPPTFSTQELWQRGLKETYCTELRPERPEAVARLVEMSLPHYQQVTEAAIFDLPLSVLPQHRNEGIQFTVHLSKRRRWLNRQTWYLRRIQGKLLNLLRLMKAVFTFDGGVDYVLWKIERHSGIKVQVSPRLRHHPLLMAWRIAWQLYRRGAFR